MRGHHDWIYMWLYGRAKTPSDLPWYREEPQDLLAEIGKTRERPGRALDVGCGSGMHAVWLAQQGWEVTGIDFTDRALEMARAKPGRRYRDRLREARCAYPGAADRAV